MTVIKDDPLLYAVGKIPELLALRAPVSVVALLITILHIEELMTSPELLELLTLPVPAVPPFCTMSHVEEKMTTGNSCIPSFYFTVPSFYTMSHREKLMALP